MRAPCTAARVLATGSILAAVLLGACWRSSRYSPGGEDSEPVEPFTDPGIDEDGGVATSRLAAELPLAVGDAHSCAVVDGSVYCWGDNAFGQLGVGASTPRRLPSRVPGIDTAVGVAAGRNHTCAWLDDGRGYCWGMGAEGRLGNGAADDAPTPQPVVGSLDIASMAAGEGHTCALTRSGSVYCWGSNVIGNAGRRSPEEIYEPAEVPDLTGVVHLAVGYNHSCAALGDGSLRCWGHGYQGQLGTGELENRAEHEPVPGLSSVVGSAAGSYDTYAWLADGTVWCWGMMQGSSLPVEIAAPPDVVGIASGSQGTYAWTRSGQPHALGRSGFEPFEPLPDAVFIAAGSRHACTVDAGGAVYCWGSNDRGQLGDGTVLDAPEPVLVAL